MDKIIYLIAFAPFGFAIWYLLKKYNETEINEEDIQNIKTTTQKCYRFVTGYPT